MAAAETTIFKINGINQTSQLAALQGNTYTVGNVSAAGKTGLSKWLFLHPVAATGKQSSVALKIEGTNQISQLSGLAGKTVTVGQSPATVGGTGKFLILNSGKGAAAKGAALAAAGKGAATTKAGTTSQMVLVKAEGARKFVDSSTFAGKSFTVMKPPAVAGAKTSNWMFLKPASGAGAAGEKIVALNIQGTGSTTASSMVGKSFVVSKAPMASGVAGPQWLAFKPAAAGGMATKGAVASTVAFNGGPCPVATPAALNGNGGIAVQNTVAKTGAAAGKTGAAVAGKSATTAQAAKVASTGTIWKGTGLSLGLGLGLGAWGPLLLVGAAAFGVGVYGYMKNNPSDEAGDMEELSLES
ncbi:MAG: hypothetical protein HQL70_01810 [Magnetococcales bacterium]|nr:hypothetical protein [Magnetococcales bacterium]